MTTRLIAAAVLLCATACREDRPPAPTADESAQLNEAETMLDQSANNSSSPQSSSRR